MRPAAPAWTVQYASAHQWYAEFLSWQGRFQEAFAESQQARQLDPLSLIIAGDYAWILYDSRQYDSAVNQCRSVLELDPNDDRARNMMILAICNWADMTGRLKGQSLGSSRSRAMAPGVESGRL